MSSNSKDIHALLAILVVGLPIIGYFEDSILPLVASGVLVFIYLSIRLSISKQIWRELTDEERH